MGDMQIGFWDAKRIHPMQIQVAWEINKAPGNRETLQRGTYIYMLYRNAVFNFKNKTRIF
jgi:hypothetical protein